jgi:hypothetical protein
MIKNDKRWQLSNSYCQKANDYVFYMKIGTFAEGAPK